MLQRFGSESNLCIVSAEENTLPLGFDALSSVGCSHAFPGWSGDNA